MDKEAAYTKIAGSGLDFGKFSPLTIIVKIVMQQAPKTRSIVTFDASRLKSVACPCYGNPD
jgi:hypothetical protein